METHIEAIRSTVSDAFLTLPLLIVGFVFFLGALTSNSGLLLLSFGQLILVPALSFLANEPGPAAFANGKFSIMKLIKWLFSILLVLGVQAKALGNSYGYLLFAAILIPFCGQYYFHQQEIDPPVFFFFNIPAVIKSLFNWSIDIPKNDEKAAATCAMIPNVDEKTSMYKSPSNWLSQLTFFAGFIMANAIAIYNQPVPVISDPDYKQQIKRQEESDTRVANRKLMVTGILTSVIVSFIVLLMFRYARTPCEAGIFYNLFPLLIIGLTGAAWFQFTYKTCGIRPTDILGIIQGMVNSNMIDNPIVCVGQGGTPQPETTPEPQLLKPGIVPVPTPPTRI